MEPAGASDEVIDGIAAIELHRQAAEPASACNEALRKLHELLDREREALQLHGAGTRHAANVEAVVLEIARVKQLAGAASPRAGRGRPRPDVAPPSLDAAAHNFARNKGRRTMGRNER